MKKLSLTKVLSLVFVCVMLLGALTLTVFANEDEKVEIVSQNMYYGDTFQIMYAINAPEGATVTAKDSKGNAINVVPFAETPTATVNGVENCKIYILEEGIAAQAIDEVITVTVEYGDKKAVKNYSVLQYTYERSLADDVTTAELEMFQALVAYAVKADVFFNNATVSFDSYQYVSVTGATVNGIDPTGMYAPGATPFANLDAIEYDAESYELAITVNGEAKSLDELKALAVADAAITVTVEIVEKETHTHDYVDGFCSGCGEKDPDYYFEMSIADALNAEVGTKVIVSGTVSEIKTPWDEGYQNISVYITDGENKLLCYRMDTNVVKGDIITVTGIVGEYNGEVQLGQGCTADVTGHDSSYDVGPAQVTIAEALELADGTDIIVTGTVIEINGEWNSTYGNMNVTIKDENGDTLYLYRLATQVAVKDVITVTGAMGSYNGAKQVAQGATAEIIGTHECSTFTEATCLALSECVICGETTGELADHNYIEGVCSVCGHEEGAAEAQKFTASKTIEELIASEGWTSTTTKQSFNLDENVSVKVNGGNNSGKAYEEKHIRIYATDSPAGTLTINVTEGYELVSVKVTTVTGTYAFLYVEGTTTDICNETVAVSGSSVVLQSVKNGSNGKQVRVLAIEVVYQEIV